MNANINQVSTTAQWHILRTGPNANLSVQCKVKRSVVEKKGKHNKIKEFKTSLPGHMQGATVIKTWLSSTPACPDGKDIRGGVGVLRLSPPSPVSLQPSLCLGGEGCRL